MSNFKKISKNINRLLVLTKRDDKDDIIWLNISNARKKEIEYLRKNFQFKLAHLRSSSGLSRTPRPIVEKTDDYLFIILHFPIMEDGVIKAEEIDFFIGDDYIITLHNNVKTLNDFFNFCKKDSLSTLSYRHGLTSVLLYEIMEKLMLDCYIILDNSAEQIDHLEDLIFEQKSKKAVSIILALRQNIINMRKTLQNHKNIIKSIKDIETDTNDKKSIEDFYDKLFIHSEKIWDALEGQKELVHVLNTTNESLLNYRLNDIMKTLTIFSVLVFPLSLLAGVFGMNTVEGMPFIESKYGFWIIIGFMGLGCIAMLIYFKKKRWI